MRASRSTPFLNINHHHNFTKTNMKLRPRHGFFRSLAAAAIALLAACATHRNLTIEQRREIFEMAWTQIRDKHYDPAMGGVDWNAVKVKTAPEVDAARDDAEFHAALTRMIHALGHSHVAILPPDAAHGRGGSAKSRKTDTNNNSETATEEGSSGIRIVCIDGRVYVAGVEERSPAANANIRVGDQIVKINNDEIAPWVKSLRKDDDPRWVGLVPYRIGAELTAPAGTAVSLQILDRTGAARDVNITLAKPAEPPATFGNLGTMPASFESRMLSGDILYVRFSPCTVPLQQKFEEALENNKKRARGLILDLRGNPGGVGGLAIGVTRAVVGSPVELGRMRMRSNEPQRFFVYPDEDPYAGPFVIIVDESSASTSEFIAGGLQGIGRARIAGTRTMGAALPSVGVTLPHGWTLQTVIADFTLNNGKSLEGAGVTPDVTYPPSVELLKQGRDAALEGAIVELKNAPTLAQMTSRATERFAGAESRSATAVMAQADPETEAFLQKMFDAAKAEKISGHRTMRVMSRISFMGNEGVSETIRMAPNKSWTKGNVPMIGETLQIFDGEHAWSSNAIQGTRELKGPELALSRRGAKFDMLASWRELFAKAEILERRTENGRTIVILQMTPPPGEGAPMQMHVDSETLRIARLDVELETEMGKMKTTTEMLEYKEFDGIPQAVKTLTKLNGIELTTLVDSVEWDVPVDPKIFEKPAKKSKAKAAAGK